jgi:hypothetical protein
MMPFLMMPFLSMTFRNKLNKNKRLLFQILISIPVLLFAVSSATAAQVTLAWDGNDPVPDGYQVFQRLQGEQYDYANPVWPTDGNNHRETTCTITNLTPEATYYFVVRAYNGSDHSSDSNEIAFTVPAAVTLTSITISGPAQLNENATAQYTCTATYSDGSSATLSRGIAWSDNSAATSISPEGLLTAANVTTDTPVTITATYGGQSATHDVTVKNTPPTLSSITINGPIQVAANGSAQYSCTAYYSDGSTTPLSSGITWSDDSAATTINSIGLLTADSTASDTTVTITASYEGKSDTHSVTVKKTPATLSSLTVSGPTQLNEGSTAQYTCTAHYADNQTANVTDSVQWRVDSNDASITPAAQLVAGTVQVVTHVTITASIDGQQADYTVTINNSNENYTLTIDIAGSGTVHLDPPGNTYDAGTVVTLTAEPDHAYAFDGWIGSVADAEANITSVIVDTDINLSVTFLEDTDLDSVPDIEEWGLDSQDADFDGNSDGIADYLQSNVTSIHTNDQQHFLTLSVPEPGRIAACKMIDPTTLDVSPPSITLPLGLIEFEIENITPGAGTALTIYLPTESKFNTFYRYGATVNDPTEHWYEFMYDKNSDTGAVYEDSTTVTLFLKDGQRGDNDLLENGVISDPGGPAVMMANVDTNPTSNAEDQLNNSASSIGPGNGCFISSMFHGMN